MVGIWGILVVGFGIERGGWYTILMFNGTTAMNFGSKVGNVAIQIEICAGQMTYEYYD